MSNILNIQMLKSKIYEIYPNYKKGFLLANELKEIIIAIGIYFFDANFELMQKVLASNNYRNLKAIIMGIFYYIEPENLTKFTEFKSTYDPDITNIIREFLYVTNLNNNKFKIFTEAKIGWEDEQYLNNIKTLLITSFMKMANKLYVNWINIQPMSNEDLLKTKFYENTIAMYTTNEYIDNVESYLENEKGSLSDLSNFLYIGEIYNVIRNFLYERIKMHKIMIFYYVKNNKFITYYDTIKKFFKLKQENIFTKYFDFRLMSVENQDKFKQFCLYLRNLNYNNDDKKIFSEDDMKLYFGVYYFNQIPFAKIDENDRKLYIEIRNLLYDITNDEIKDDFFARNITNEKLNKIYDNYINNENYIKEFYKYVQKEIYGFFSTIYINKIFKDLNLYPKIIYNFFKNWMIDPDSQNEDKKKYTLLPRNYDHLTKNQKKRFISQINRTDEINFNIPNIQRKSNNLINLEYHKQFILNNLIDIFIFPAMIKEGILSKIVYNPKCIEKSLQGENNSLIKRNVRENVFTAKNIQNFNNCYYYLGNISYEDIKIPNYELNRNFTIYEHLSHEKTPVFPFYTQYATNWVSQLFLYFKFLNCRVLYVTGATGVGKSTQVPKLLFYGLKAFDYKISGKMICTQPRIDPTVGIPEYVSKELGLPINSDDKDGKGKVLEPKMFQYLQYQYAGDKVVDNYTQYYLKFATDGLFFEQLINNPSLKEQNKISLKLNSKNKFTTRNMYDIIAVDEAHEHNKNMDYILTVMRNSLYYNNDLKLVIISATMEDDEKYYRYYYRHINDNFKYPLNRIVLDPDKNGIRTTRFFVDRRVHIEPPPVPGESATKFPIKDVYLPFETDYDIAEKESISRIKKICDESTDGNILLFTTGKKEIESISRKLSSTIPENVLIFPYFSEMPNAQKYKADVQKIQSRIKNYNFDRVSFIDFMFKIIKESEIKKTNQKYSRAVIIATNVAEASITIENLKFVVELGYYNFVGYNYLTGLPIIKKEKIDDNSRRQRRGRTGRKNAGTVYYMYPENDRKSVISIKSIESSNITFDYLKFLPDTKNEKYFFNFDNDPYYSSLNNKNKEDIINSFKEEQRRGYDEVIRSQFLYENELLQPDNIDFRFLYLDFFRKTKIEAFNDMKNIDFSSLYKFKETGFDPEVLYDNYGMFFITHPEENNIQRLNTFVINKYRLHTSDNWKPFDSIPDDIKFFKMKTIFNNLLQYSFIKQTKTNIYDFEKLDFIKYFTTVIKSKLDFQMINGEQMAITYLISKMFLISDDVLLIISLLKACEFDLRNLIFSEKKINPKTGKPENIFKLTKYKSNLDYNYQIIQLYEIAKSIFDYVLPILNKELKSKNFYINLNFLSNININEFKNKKEYDESNIKLISYKYYINKYMLSYDERKMLDKIIKDSNDKEKEPHEYLLKNLNSILTDFFKENSKYISNISKHLEVNSKVIPSFIKTFITFKIYNYYDKDIKENFQSSSNKDSLLNKISFTENKKTSILNSFFSAFKLNVDKLTGQETSLLKTNTGFENISISSNNKFFYITKAVLEIIDFLTKKPKDIVLYNSLNRLNFKIIDLQKEFLKIG